MDTSSDNDIIPHTMEKNIKGIIISFNDDKKHKISNQRSLLCKRLR